MSGYRFRRMTDEEATQISGWLLAGLESARERFSPERFSLSVATFNERAGFRRGNEYMHNTNGGEYLFLSMAGEA